MDDCGLWIPEMPIFHAEIVGEEGGEVLFSPLRCFTNDGPTIHAASNRPCELHPGAPNPQDLLPPRRHVEWVWRTKTAGRIGKEKPSCDLSEVPEIAEGRHVSTLSAQNLLALLQELMDASSQGAGTEKCKFHLTIATEKV